ncbi:MAG: hypothetical protein H6537_08635 [Bacteroidales bacterium]|nr:hypothetical protein [Bacteroidales bacterium]HRX31310.1 hypothetical protein [Tenuifilaceae bacterium]
MKKELIKCAVGIVFLALLGSCHSKYLSSNLTVSRDIAWNTDSTEFAFLTAVRLYRKPEGISRFPDGGQSVGVYSNVAIYVYRCNDSTLKRVVDLNRVRPLCNNLDYEFIDIVFKDDSLLYFKPHIFDYAMPSYLKKCKTHADTVMAYELYSYIASAHVCNIGTGMVRDVDSVTFESLYAKPTKSVKTEKVRKEIRRLSLEIYGVKLQEVYPQSRDEYIEYIVQKEGDETVRNAVVNQVFVSMSAKQIDAVIKSMSRFKDRLRKKDAKSLDYRDSLKYKDYEEYYRQIVPKLEAIK